MKNLTPKRKAEELVQQFIDVPILQDFGGMDKRIAKECALIALGEILKHNPSEPCEYIDRDLYWEDVRNEIKNL